MATDTVKMAAWVAGGVLLGAGAGLLFAPKSGADTRREITQYAKRTQIQAIRMGRTLKEGVEKALHAAKEVPMLEEKKDVQAMKAV
jgi:gas vesicle protein